MTYLPGDTALRPWGRWEVLAIGHDYAVKRIYVAPHQRLSLQHHEHREEVWTVLLGPALVDLEGQRTVLQAGESVRIPRLARHRLGALETTVVVLETQLGHRLREDDIVRHHDDYHR